MDEVTLFALDGICRRHLGRPLEETPPDTPGLEDALNAMVWLLVSLRAEPDVEPDEDAEPAIRQAVLDLAVTGDTAALDNLPDGAFALLRAYLVAIVECYAVEHRGVAIGDILIPRLPNDAARAEALLATEILANRTPQRWRANIGRE